MMDSDCDSREMEGVFGNADDDDDCDDLDNDNNSRLFASSLNGARFIASQDAMAIKIWTMAIARSSLLSLRALLSFCDRRRG